jgi:hypothetical protein
MVAAQPLDQWAQPIRVTGGDGHVVTAFDTPLGQRRAESSCSDDADVHGSSVPGRVTDYGNF